MFGDKPMNVDGRRARFYRALGEEVRHGSHRFTTEKPIRFLARPVGWSFPADKHEVKVERLGDLEKETMRTSSKSIIEFSQVSSD